MYALLLTAVLPLFVAGKATIGDRIAALEAANSPLLQYPTQLTQNVVPKPIHSHNDCSHFMFVAGKAFHLLLLQIGEMSLS